MATVLLAILAFFGGNNEPERNPFEYRPIKLGEAYLKGEEIARQRRIQELEIRKSSIELARAEEIARQDELFSMAWRAAIDSSGCPSDSTFFRLAFSNGMNPEKLVQYNQLKSACLAYAPSMPVGNSREAFPAKVQRNYDVRSGDPVTTVEPPCKRRPGVPCK